MQKETEELIEMYGAAEVFPVVGRFPADLITPFGAYLKLSKNADCSFLFESVEGGENLARYSFLGANPEIFVSETGGNILVRTNGSSEIAELPFYEYLKQKLGRRKIAPIANLPSFIGGAVGFFDFGTVGHFEPVLKNFIKTPNGTSGSQFGFYRTTIAFDHARQEIAVIRLVFADRGETRDELFKRLKLAENENSELFRQLENAPYPEITGNGSETEAEITSNWKKEDFIEAVAEIKDLINAGECYQVVLSQCFTKKTNAAPEAIYRALRALNPSPYMILLKHGARAVVGASPEMLVRCRAGKLEYRPIAGTRPRGQNETEDEQLAAEMRADQKEVSEHTMLVDLGRNDLGRVSKYGSVRVRNLMNVEKFSHVQHLVTYISADLRDECDWFDALSSCFPAGTVTGAPKIRAIRILSELEPTPRGIYAGAVGYIDYAGNLDTCIAIRTLVLENGVARVQAGAGIVADSVPEKEYLETVHKAQGLLKAIELAESGKYTVSVDRT